MKSHLKLLFAAFVIFLPASEPAFGQSTEDIPADSVRQMPDTALSTDDESQEPGYYLPPGYLERIAEAEALPDTVEDISLPRVIGYNFEEELKQSFLSDRIDIINDAARSILHDAGDYFKLYPSSFIVDHENTPIRKTVSPYALPGGRVNVILDNRPLNPLEHLLEPDNRMDFNDIPTCQIRQAYIVEGPLGLVFGAANATSSLIMLPHRPDTTSAESKMVVDKGSFGYAYTRGLFTHRNKQGRQMQAAAGYRKADGAFLNQDDDAYHQWAELNQPLTRQLWLNLSGRLYRRTGTFSPRADVSLFHLDRSRRDRDLNANLEYNHAPGIRSVLEFRHQRSEAKIERQFIAYFRNLDVFHNSVALSHNRKLGGLGLRARLSGAQERYDDKNFISRKRYRGFFDFSALTGDSTH
ncbi:MAG: hypothetical protein JSV44_09420, partial [Candidatus Zixiibacteriota bacterium]